MRSSFSFAFFVFYLATSLRADPGPPVDPSIISIPLQRIEHRLGKRSGPDLAAWARVQGSSLLSKYGIPPAESGSGGTRKMQRRGVKKARGMGYVGLQNALGNALFYGEVQVGTPPKPFQVVFDTGSADFWLASSSCVAGCPSGVPSFDPSTSSSSSGGKTSFSVQYGSGIAQGKLYSDNLSFGSGYAVSGTSFGVVTNTSGVLRSSVPNVSGIMGLGFQSIAASGLLPAWQVLAQGGNLAEPLFSFALQSSTTSTGSVNGGVLTVGGTNSSLHTGNIAYTNVTSQGYWLIPLQGVSVGTKQLIGNETTGQAAIDTGTSLIGAPPEALATIFSKVPGAQMGTGDYSGYYLYPCDSQPSISLTFGQMAFPVNADTFNLGQVTSTLCLSPFFSVSSLATSDVTFPSWIIGDSFLMGVYSVFRYSPGPSVGFAALSPAFRADLTSSGSTAAGTSASAPVPVSAPASASPSVSSHDLKSGSPIGLATPRAWIAVAALAWWVYWS